MLTALLSLLTISAATAQEANTANINVAPKERKWHFEADLRYHLQVLGVHRSTTTGHYTTSTESTTTQQTITQNGNTTIVKTTQEATVTEHDMRFNYKGTDKFFDNGYNDGYALMLTETYDVNSRLTVGAGVGLSRHDGIDFNGVPIYATVRWKPWGKHPFAYVYGEAGPLGIPTLNLGYGFSVKAGKRCRLDFKLGYDMQVRKDKSDFTTLWGSNNDLVEGKIKNTSSSHCLQASIGLVW